MSIRHYALVVVGMLIMSAGIAQPKVSVVERKFIYTEAPTPECHASTIVEVAPGKLMAAWFGGTYEKHPDVCIWLSTHENGAWSKPVKMADGVEGDKRYPTWNPVLFKAREGKLFLFYKVGPSPQEWWGMVRTSDNDGKTWSQPERLPDGILGPIKNKPVQLADGTLLSPSSTESKANGWKAHIERSRDLGKTWELLPIDPKTNLDVIQGSILKYPNNRLQMLCRSKQDRVVEVWSEDGGKTWGTLQKLSLLNPNSGTDAVTLSNGWQLLVYNPTTRGKQWDHGRQKLNVALSKDGKTWTDVVVLEDKERGEYSYPAVIQSKDGRVHITYTSERKKVQYVALDVKN